MIILNFNNISRRIGYLDDSYKCSPVWHRIDLNTIWYVFCLRIYLAIFILFSYSNALIAIELSFFLPQCEQDIHSSEPWFPETNKTLFMVYFGMSLHINSKNKKPLKKTQETNKLVMSIPISACCHKGIEMIIFIG